LKKIIGTITFLLLVILLSISGCKKPDNSASNNSSSIHVSSTSTSMSLSSSSAPTVVGEVSISASEDIVLTKMLDTPIRIIDNSSDLNQLYNELNISTLETITPDFSKDKVVYIQRKNLVDINLSTEEDGVRLDSSTLEPLYEEPISKAKIIVLQNIYNQLIYFTKSTANHRKCGLALEFKIDAIVKEVLDLNRSSVLGIYTIDTNESYFSQTSLGDIITSFEHYGVSENVPEVDFVNTQVISAGFYLDTSSVKYQKPILQNIYTTDTHWCNISGPATNYNFVFTVNAVRSDCAEFDSMNSEKNVTFYKIEEINTVFERAQTIQGLHVKSCKGYVTTPPIEDVKWYQDIEVLKEVFP